MAACLRWPALRPLLLLAFLLKASLSVNASKCSKGDLQRSLGVIDPIYRTCYSDHLSIAAALGRHLKKEEGSKGGPLTLTLVHTDEGSGVDAILYGLNRTVFAGQRSLQIDGHGADLAGSSLLEKHFAECGYGVVLLKNVQDLRMPEPYELQTLLDYVNMSPFQKAIFVLTLRVSKEGTAESDPAEVGQHFLEHKWRSSDPNYTEKFEALMVRVFQYTFWANGSPELDLSRTVTCVDDVITKHATSACPWSAALEDKKLLQKILTGVSVVGVTAVVAVLATQFRTPQKKLDKAVDAKVGGDLKEVLADVAKEDSSPTITQESSDPVSSHKPPTEGGSVSGAPGGSDSSEDDIQGGRSSRGIDAMEFGSPAMRTRSKLAKVKGQESRSHAFEGGKSQAVKEEEGRKVKGAKEGALMTPRRSVRKGKPARHQEEEVGTYVLRLPVGSPKTRQSREAFADS